MIISKFYSNKLFERLFHTLNYCLKQELQDCHSVLDLGCGPDSPLQYVNLGYKVGVEIWKPYLESSKKKHIHNVYIDRKLQDLNFENNSFDAVLLIDVLEHLSREDAFVLLKKVNKWAKKKIIITTPNGFIEQPILDKNPFQKHLSGWSYTDMHVLGFKVAGLAGLKILRKSKEEEDSMGEDITISIKYKPKIFWFIVASLSQIITYHFPKYAFGLFCVKKNS